MKHTRLIALVAALALVASPMTWARSGFGGSRGSVSSARVSAPSVSRGSGFGSMRASGSTTPAAAIAAAPSPRPAASGFGSSLYAATASKQAASTYAANKAAATPYYGRNTQSVASNTVNAGGNTYNSYHYNATPAYSPAPTVVHHYHDHYYDSGSGSNNFLFGYLMGRATEPRTVVVQPPAQYVEAQPQYAPQPAPQYAPAQAPAQGQYEPQPAGVVTPAGVQPSDVPAQAQAASSAWTSAAQSGAQNVPVPPQKSGHPVLHFFAWVFGLGLVGFGLYKLLGAWSARKARYTPTNHYKL